MWDELLQLLFELCGYFDTLVADVQQIYDVSIPNDRLVLQIKGTVAELELSSLRTRLRAGAEAKAARGELKILLPPGYVYDADEQIVVDPDERVQQAVRSMFEKFEHATSVRQLALSYRDTQSLFPIRKPKKRDVLVWALPQRYVLHKLLSHPIYAGVYARGRTQSYVDYADGKLVKRTKRILSPDEWKVCIRDHHEAYISWQQFLNNQAKLAEARPRWSKDDNRCAVREGRALLAGMLRCSQYGLMALVRRDVLHTHQVTDFAPWRIARAELDSEPVRTLVEILKATGRLPPQEGSPQDQRRLFADKSTN